MALISPSDQDKLRATLAVMTRPVRLMFFTQTIGCETCPETRQILDELLPLSDKITVEEVNLVLEGERARQYGIDRAPAVVIEYQDGAQGAQGALPANHWQDSRIRFLGAPAGYEFMPLVQAVLLAGGGPSKLSERSRQRIASLDRPVTMQVFTTPT
jgi:alkyl hydroperoxide reductase subunit AhpF